MWLNNVTEWIEMNIERVLRPMYNRIERIRMDNDAPCGANPRIKDDEISL